MKRAEGFVSIFKFYLTSVFFAFVFVAVPIVFFTVVSSKMALLGVKSYTVMTGSMTPLIPVGSVVYVFPGSDYKVGDVITFKREKINVTHRIVDTVDKNGKHISTIVSPLSKHSTQEVFYKTKGDANNAVDSELVPASAVIGNTLFHFPAIGKFSSFVRSVPGFILLVIFPITLFVMFEIFTIKKEFEKETEKKVLKRMGVI